MSVRAAARVVAIVAAAACVERATAARADAPVLARGDRVALIGVTGNAAPRGPNALFAALPPQPFAVRPARIPLPGGVCATPLVAADGTLVVAVASPASVRWLGLDGRERAAATLEERPGPFDLARGRDGAVFVLTERRELDTVAPDGSVRGATAVGAAVGAGAVARGDGAVLVASNPGALPGQLQVFSPHGELVATHALPGRVIDGPCVATDGTSWLLLAQGVVSVADDGRIAELGFGRGATELSLVGDDTLAVEMSPALEFHTRRGALRSRIETGPIAGRWPLPNGTLAVVRGAAPELWLLDRDAVALARLPLAAGRVVGVLADPTGALLVTSAGGEITALEANGAPRWTLLLRDTVIQPPVALPGGGVVLTPGSSGLIVLR